MYPFCIVKQLQVIALSGELFRKQVVKQHTDIITLTINSCYIVLKENNHQKSLHVLSGKTFYGLKVWSSIYISSRLLMKFSSNHSCHTNNVFFFLIFLFITSGLRVPYGQYHFSFVHSYNWDCIIYMLNQICNFQHQLGIKMKSFQLFISCFQRK